MDGINGLLGGYLVLVFSFLYLWSGSIDLIEIKHLLASIIAGILAFLYFNFRRTAETFMGDAGSTALGLIAATATTRIIQIVPKSSISLYANIPFARMPMYIVLNLSTTSRLPCSSSSES